jgi:hypothetical protein
VRSSLQPGSSLHDTGTQRERARVIGVGSRIWAATGTTAAVALVGAVTGGAGIAQPAAMPRMPTIKWRDRAVHGAQRRRNARTMWVVILEMLAALALLLFIVWWTMFSGRRHGERRHDGDGPDTGR